MTTNAPRPNGPRSPSMPTTPWRTFREEPAPSSKQSGGPFVTLAIAIGLGVLGSYMLDLHGHTCDKCGRRWRHFGAFNLGDEQSHTCSRCGEVQWWKNGAPHILRGSQFVTPPTDPAHTLAAAAAVPALPTATASQNALPAAVPSTLSTSLPQQSLSQLSPSPQPSPMALARTERRRW